MPVSGVVLYLLFGAYHLPQVKCSDETKDRSELKRRHKSANIENAPTAC